ncbi:ankyrin repeat-containing domain protein [Pelagophyceae sp. CCMP2097]|nr:ankyrin repeat-containing domain protein [Pelagophyceae sp. CCMP2097]
MGNGASAAADAPAAPKRRRPEAKEASFKAAAAGPERGGPRRALAESRSLDETSFKGALGPESVQLLEAAARRCDLATLESLASRGATSWALAAAVRAAAEAGECEAVELLLMLDRGAAAPRFADARGRTALHYAAASDAARAPDIVSLLTLAGRGGGVDAADHDGETPVHAACRAGREATLAVLVACGADLVAADLRGGTPLSVAVRFGHVRCVAYLKEVRVSVAAKASRETADVARIVAVWGVFFENAAKRAMAFDDDDDASMPSPRAPPSPTRRRRPAHEEPRAPRVVWTEAWDAANSCPYYMDFDSGETAWLAPAGAHVDGDGLCGWVQHFDDEGVAYYAHEFSGDTRWEPPYALADLFDALAHEVARLDGHVWKRCYDVVTQAHYYQDEETGAASWVAPADHATDWTEVPTDDGETYWLHEPSGLARWARPVLRCVAQGEAGFCDVATHRLVEEDFDGEVLSADWTCCYDDEGRLYYCCESTGVSQWEEPSWD